MPKRMNPKTGTFLEQVVTVLERHLNQAAKVHRNMKLPVSGDPLRESRQCDVVIEVGEELRKTISIVEVHDRGATPDFNTFHGWCTKMREVGAQHLLRVSAKGYPKSVLTEAERLGPTVRLLTLNEDYLSWCGTRVSMPFTMYRLSAAISMPRYPELKQSSVE